MQHNLPTVTLHHSLTLDGDPAARWAEHIGKVVIDLGPDASIHMDLDTARRFTDDLADAVDAGRADQIVRTGTTALPEASQ